MGILATMIENLAHNGAWTGVKSGQDLDLQIVVPGQLYAAVMEDLCTVFDKPEHFVVRNPGKADGIGIFPGIPVINAVHIGEDLAPIRMQCRGQGYRRGV